MARNGDSRLRARRAVLVAIASLGLMACTPVYENHGFVPSDEELALIEVGKDTREVVAATVGKPSASGLLNDVGWFYVQSRFETVGPREPKEVDRQVVAVTFTEAGLVQNVAHYGLEDGRIVTISRRVTGLVPSASDGTASRGLWRTPIARASFATRSGPTCCMSWAVIVFFE